MSSSSRGSCQSINPFDRTRQVDLPLWFRPACAHRSQIRNDSIPLENIRRTLRKKCGAGGFQTYYPASVFARRQRCCRPGARQAQEPAAGPTRCSLQRGRCWWWIAFAVKIPRDTFSVYSCENRGRSQPHKKWNKRGTVRHYGTRLPMQTVTSAASEAIQRRLTAADASAAIGLNTL